MENTPDTEKSLRLSDIFSRELTVPIVNTTITPLAEIQRIRASIPRIVLQTESIIAQENAYSPIAIWNQSKVVKLQTHQIGSFDSWYFIGDVHADFFALSSLLQHIESRDPNARVVLLGDLVDRGEFPLETVALVLDWGLSHPGCLYWIAGNHDIGVDFCPDKSTFRALVRPAEFVDWLNLDDCMVGFRREFGLLFRRLVSGLPRAILFPDGLLATHGGFPLSDRHPQGLQARCESEYMAWLNEPSCLQDFTWARIHKAPKKLPDRHSTGTQYGYKDFADFCKLRPEWFAPKRMITGHEHPQNGFILHPTYRDYPVLTLVGFGYSELQPNEITSYRDKLFHAQAQEGLLPRIHEVEVDTAELTRFNAHIHTSATVSLARETVLSSTIDETVIPGDLGLMDASSDSTQESSLRSDSHQIDAVECNSRASAATTGRRRAFAYGGAAVATLVAGLVFYNGSIFEQPKRVVQVEIAAKINLIRYELGRQLGQNEESQNAMRKLKEAADLLMKDPEVAP